MSYDTIEYVDELLQKHVRKYFEAESDIEQSAVTISTTEITAALSELHKAISALKPSGNEYSTLVSQFVNLLMRRDASKKALPPPIKNEVTVRASIRAGIVSGIEEHEVDGLKPWQITKIASRAADLISEAYTPTDPK